VGHSRPALDCPEVRAIAVQLNGRPSSDPQRSNIYRDALGTCRERLTSVGVDLSAYGIEEASADVEDLRRAVGVDSWNVIAFGSSSRVALEVVRRWPEHVRSLVLDAPSFPGRDVQMAALDDTRRAITALEESCRAQPTCALAGAGVEASLEAVVTSLDDAPQRVDVEGSAVAVPGGGPVEVAVDGAAFARTLRYALGSDDRTVLPDVVAGVSANGLRGRDFQALSSDPALCLGYAAGCPERTFVAGAYYSSFCRDLLPFADVGAAAARAASDPILGSAFAPDPQVDACAVWDVDPADASIDTPVSSTIPTLIFVGRFDPFTSAQAARDATADWGHVTVAETSAGHNNLGLDCARSIRKAFVDDPTLDPDLSCLSSSS
jgi:pimeloyl-ACP methyl ester carboxylesterase